MSTHKYLDSTGLGQVWGKIKNYADDAKTMVVTVSRSNDNYVADKTFSEIVAHVNSGGTVICKKNNGGDFQNEIYELGTIENNYIIFHLTQLYDVDNNNDGYSDQVWFLASHIIISNNNVVEVGDVVNGPLPDASTTTPLAPGVASIGTEYERYALGDHVHPSELFVVNITSTTTEGVTTYTADKTFAQITAAVEAGKQVTAINNNYVYYYTWKNNSDIIFHSKTLTLFSSTSQITNRTFRIHNDEVISLHTNTFQNKLTFDSTPTENSTNPVTSGGVYTALANAGSTPDWDENDSTSDAYIANRTHYRTSLGAMSNLHPLILSGGNWSDGPYTGESGNSYGFVGTWEFDFNNDYDSLMSDFPDESITLLDLENPEIVVIADGTELELTYIKKPITDSEYSIYVFYNNDFEICYTDDNDGYMPGDFGIASNTDYQSIEIKLKMAAENFEYHTLDDGYLNGYLIKKGTGLQSEIFNGITSYETYQIYISGDANVLEYTFATPGAMPPEGLPYCASAIKVEGHDDVEVVNIEIDRDNNHYGITFNKTFDAELPVEDYPINIIVPSKIASGDYSHLEGKARYALGEASHAEGQATTASGDNSHAEGYSTIASGYISHAEGQATTASGMYSHAEGYSTTASGYYSHAEGSNTTASGISSHAEGTRTTAQRRSQHVFGEYNVLDTTGNITLVKGSYVEIVGNGTADNARSNARTLDWSGNEVLAGKLTVGTGPTNNMDVTTKQYVDNSISTAITNINSFNTAIVQSLPTTNIDPHTIYFISNSGSTGNIYDEHMYINNNWEKIGSTSIDLSNYLAKDNTTSYTPTGDYNPATKKYVDDATASITDEKLSTGTIGSNVYYPIVGTNTASATTKYIDSTGFKYDATSSTNGYARLYLGNGTASGTEGSKYGRLMIYGTTAYAVTLNSGSPTENRDISLPNKNGTIALTSDITSNLSGLTDTTITSPTNGQVLMYNSTTSKWENTSLPIYNGGVSS